MGNHPAKGGRYGVATNLDRVLRGIRSAAPLTLAAVIAVGIPDLGTAQTMSFSQPVTVLRGQPATTSSQADQPPPTAEAPLSQLVPLFLLLPLLVVCRLSLGLGCSMGLGVASRRVRRCWRLLSLPFPPGLFPPPLFPSGLRPPGLYPSRPRPSGFCPCWFCWFRSPRLRPHGLPRRLPRGFPRRAR
jgi:hypothetical protein